MQTIEFMKFSRTNVAKWTSISLNLRFKGAFVQLASHYFRTKRLAKWTTISLREISKHCHLKIYTERIQNRTNLSKEDEGLGVINHWSIFIPFLLNCVKSACQWVASSLFVGIRYNQSYSLESLFISSYIYSRNSSISMLIFALKCLLWLDQSYYDVVIWIVIGKYS